MCGRDYDMVARPDQEPAGSDTDHKTCGLCSEPGCGHAPINFFGVMFDTDLCAAHLKAASISKSSETKDEVTVADSPSRP